MRYERCNSLFCRRPFQINEFDGQRIGLKVTGEITCPHCGHKEKVLRNSIFLVHALSPEEEAGFREEL